MGENNNSVVKLASIRDHALVLAARDETNDAQTRHDKARKELEKAKKRQADLEERLTVESFSGKGFNTEDVQVGRATIETLETEVHLRGRILKKARIREDGAITAAQAQVAEALKPRFVEAVKAMNKALLSAKEKGRQALEVRGIAERLGCDMGAFPPVGWRELDSERGESRLENWQTYVEATADIAL